MADDFKTTRRCDRQETHHILLSRSATDAKLFSVTDYAGDIWLDSAFGVGFQFGNNVEDRRRICLNWFCRTIPGD